MFKEMALNELHHFDNLHKMLIDILPDEQKQDMGCYRMLHEHYVEKYNKKHISFTDMLSFFIIRFFCKFVILFNIFYMVFCVFNLYTVRITVNIITTKLKYTAP